MRINLIAASVLYSAAAFNFYLLSFYLKYFSGNIFENSVFYAFSDLVAMLLVAAALKLTSMQNGVRIACLIAITGGVMYLFLSDKEDLIPLIICLARVG